MTIARARSCSSSLTSTVARLLALGLMAGVLLGGAACGTEDGTSDDDTASESTPTPTTTAPALDPVDSIRDVDFADPALQGPLVDQAGGGQVVGERVMYVDLTDDGEEEAVVIVESGGTQGDVGAGVYRLVNGQPELVHFAPAGGRVEVRQDSLLVTQEGVYEDDDAECCPSQLRETVYRWDGDGFEVSSEQVIPNPRG